MPSLENEDFCTLAEYNKARENRLGLDQLESGAVYNMFLRAIGENLAQRSVVRVPELPSNLYVVRHALELAFLDDDLQVRFSTVGSMRDGMWNKAGQSLLLDGLKGRTAELKDGVFQQYSDGIGNDVWAMFEKEIGVSV